MATTAQRRKGAGAPRSLEAGAAIVNVTDQGSPSPAAAAAASAASTSIKMATVRRRSCGTGPFDKHWLNMDCCGLFCAGFTYCLHMYGVYAVCAVLLPPWMSIVDENGFRHLSMAGHFHRVAFTFVAVMAVYAHFRAMTTDPGSVPPDAQPLDEESGDVEAAPPPRRRGKRLCRRCNAFKPPRAHHCSVCQRCIIKMDHHCPWVNNCVGIGNHKFFLLFVFYTFVSCIYSLSLVVMRFSVCMGGPRHRRGSFGGPNATCLDHPSQLLNILGLVVEALLFGLFTFCMMIDQSSVVTTKLTHIDRLKGDLDSTGVAGIVEVFGMNLKRNTGARFRMDWLSPFARACFPARIQDEIMGFCRPCLRTNKSDDDLAPSGGGSGMVRSVTEIV